MRAALELHDEPASHRGAQIGLAVSASPLRRAWTASALIVFNTALLFLLANGLSWLWLRARFPMPAPRQWHMERGSGLPLKPVFPELSDAQIARLMEETWTRTHAFEPFTGHRERPFAGEWVNVDEHGYRRTDQRAPWPPVRGKSVFLFGGSTTFGMGVPDGQTIAAHLERALHRTDPSIHVYNFGRGYYYSQQERALFISLLEQNAIPALAVFIDGLNDFILQDPAYSDRLRRFMDGGVAQVSPRQRLPLVVVVRGLLADVRDSSGGAEASGEPGDTVLDASSVIERYIASKQIVEAVASTHEVKTLFVWQPVPTYNYDLQHHLFMTDRGWRSNSGDRTRDGYREFASRIAQDPQPGLLWLADLQQELREPLYVDQVHYTGAMSRRIAEAIAERITSGQLLEQ